MKLNDLFTRREKEILVGLCKGLTNREIADRLCVSSHTVKAHVFHMFDKFCVSSLAQLINMAVTPDS